MPSNLFENFTKNKEKNRKLIDRKGRGLSCSIVSLLNSHYIFVVKQNPLLPYSPLAKRSKRRKKSLVIIYITINP